PLGVHARRRAAAGSGKHRLDRESVGHVLMTRVISAVLLVFFSAAQQATCPAPAAADWASLAKLPDFNGVWELSFGAPVGRGGGGRGRGVGPSLTPEYAAKKKAFDANPPEDNETANCLPPGMPGIMGQP